jgi:hypothetical protein
MTKKTQQLLDDYLPLLCRDEYVHKRSLFNRKNGNGDITSQAKWEIARKTLIMPSKYLRSIYLLMENKVCYEIGIL